MYDAACNHYGLWVDAKLNETVTSGKGRNQKTTPKYQIAELFAARTEDGVVPGKRYRSIEELPIEG